MKAREYHSKTLEDFIRSVDSRPDHKERLHGTHLMMRWNIALGNQAICMMSGAMEDECDDLIYPFREIWYNEIEESLNIEIAARPTRENECTNV